MNNSRGYISVRDAVQFAGNVSSYLKEQNHSEFAKTITSKTTRFKKEESDNGTRFIQEIIGELYRYVYSLEIELDNYHFYLQEIKKTFIDLNLSYKQIKIEQKFKSEQIGDYEAIIEEYRLFIGKFNELIRSANQFGFNIDK